MTDDEKELVKAGADAAMRPFANLVEKLFGGPVKEIGGMWTDRLRVRRFERQLKLYEKVQKMIAVAGFEPHHIPDSVSIPLLSAATLAEDEGLQERWAALLANAAKPGTGVHPGFVQVLENMGALDAAVLDEAYRRLLAQLKEKGNIQIVYLSYDQINEVLKAVKENGGETCLDNLVRLRLLLPDPTHPSASATSEGLKLRPTFQYYLTRFGLEFYFACQAPAIRDNLIAESPSLAALIAYPKVPPY
jgi:hypothetical protein